MTMTTELAPRQQQQNGNGNAIDLKRPVGSQATLKGLLEASKAQIAMVLPQHLTPERIIKVALVASVNNPKLFDCTRESVLQSVIQAASLGLDPGGPLGSAYLVPYGNKCTLIPGYRGLIDLARRSGEIVSINAEVVYKQDKFIYRKGISPTLEHEPDLYADLRDEDIVGAYMIAHLKGGGLHIEFMNRQQIEAVRKVSKAGNYGPWKDHYPEMCRKTVVRRGFKYLPVSSERLSSAIEHDNRVDGIITAGEGRDAAAALNARLTRRPVSENQQFEGDPDAARFIDADEGGSSSPSGPTGAEQATPTTETPPSVPDSAPAPAERLVIPAEDGPMVATWDETMMSLNEAAMDANLSETDLRTRVNLWLIAKKAKGKEESTRVSDRLALVAAVREGRLGSDGKITAAN
jgi:recombination protein RecT